MNNLKLHLVCVCGRITDLLTPPSFCDLRQCILLLIRNNLVFHLINIAFVFSCLIRKQELSCALSISISIYIYLPCCHTYRIL